MSFSVGSGYRFVEEVTKDLGTVNAASVKLVSFSVAGVTPDGVYTVVPSQALPTGIALGAPYCVTAGTLVVPVVNPTAGGVTGIETDKFRIVRL